MALIEIEQLITRIERAKSIYEKSLESAVIRGRVAMCNDIINTLRNECGTLLEQPELKPMNISSAGGGMSTTPPSYKLDVKPEQLIELDDENAADKKAVKEIVKTVRKEITRQVREMVGKRPVEGLEEKIEKYFQGWFNDDEYGDAVTPDYIGVNVDKCKEIARHFYDLGCRHTAVMYDDIEYERQRAEEAELSGDLEEELENYAKLYPFEAAGSYRNLITLARHFAEWGAEQKAIEIFKRQNCPSCGTQRCTGDGEWLEGCEEFQRWRAEHLKK